MATDFNLLRRRLKTERESLLERLEVALHPTDESHLGDHPRSDDELASGSLESWKQAALEKRIRDQVAEVEHALRKFEEGTYGLCDICKQPIEPERLEALPWASLCLSCKSRQAKNAKG